MNTTGLSYTEQADASFMADYFVDHEILNWDPSPRASDLAKRGIDILGTFRDDPAQVSPKQVWDFVSEEGSQVQNADGYFNHVFNVAGVYSGMVRRLLDNHPDLALPTPEEASGMGLVHDLNAVYADYQRTGQQDKQIGLYFHARHLGIPRLSHEVAMHCRYLNILKMIHDGAEFPNSDAYGSMGEVLRGDGPLSFGKISEEFSDFMRARDNLPLMVLTVADYTAWKRPEFDQESFQHDFQSRLLDIAERYRMGPKREGKPLSALGMAFETEGPERIMGYRNIITDLLSGEDERIAPHREVAGFWK